MATDQIRLFARHAHHRTRIDKPPQQRRTRGIWQRRFWEHTIRDEQDFARHVDDIHFNPVKHGVVRRARVWPHSSFRRMVKLGIYPEDGGGDLDEGDCKFGEM